MRETWHVCISNSQTSLVSKALVEMPIFLPPTKEEINAIARDVCLSVCLLARLLKNACIDVDELLRVDGCRDVDNWSTFEPDPDHSPDTGTLIYSEFFHPSKIT